MWWRFWKRTEAAETVEAKPDIWANNQKLIEILRSWRDVGQEFEYLGRRMVVVSHSVLDTWPDYPFPRLYIKPELKARYADNRGEIHTLIFSEAEAMMLASGTALPPNVGVEPRSAAGKDLE